MPQIILKEERARDAWKRLGPFVVAAGIGLVVLVIFGLQAVASSRYTRLEQQTKVLDDKGDTAGEMTLLSDYVASKPPSKYLYLSFVQLGDLTYRTHDYAAAMSWYQEAETAGPKPATVHVLVGVAQSAAGIQSNGVAISYYRQAIKLLPDKSTDREPYEDQIRFLGGTP